MPAAVICDDDPVVRRVLRAVLEDAGWEVVGEAGKAVDAIDIVRVAQPDVLVLDVSLPGLNGLEAAAALGDVGERTAVVLLSAFELTPEEVIECGATAALAKSDLGALPTVLVGVQAGRMAAGPG